MDEWELNGWINNYFKDRSEKRIDVKIYNGYRTPITQKESIVFPLYDLYTDKYIGNIIYIAIRSFMRKYENRLDEVVKIDLHKPKDALDEFHKIPKNCFGSRVYYIDGNYYHLDREGKIYY